MNCHGKFIFMVFIFIYNYIYCLYIYNLIYCFVSQTSLYHVIQTIIVMIN